MAALQIAFEAPDNSHTARPLPSKAIDLEHLSNQTMGDKALEIEVLQLFARQTRQLLKNLSEDTGGARGEIAHRLKGAALGIGAFAVAEAAGAVERDPSEPAHIALLSAAVLDAELFILRLCR
ncbi:HPt (histidine-containing phosphotransfer) domain-containing protein [Pararhizobium capsulatum DSM 1112]|uniref:HPt (Histidine-containing phosphotransfer) domain-containing protein n=1 Tax=Pararhizobium capsulatum DSM 1112 TaxID=1121113 RepID=A0ABU0BQJ7_9HYPH|nr:Hpt domain-containing protein [Pararhizobium capsulatum]MDQ0320523.1 HPt (histidine-containing phosphotransfer) domain-containing protein [Pararhizobium capsulatum DSM 1112]